MSPGFGMTFVAVAAANSTKFLGIDGFLITRLVVPLRFAIWVHFALYT